jgi:3'-5' exoribonuclease
MATKSPPIVPLSELENGQEADFFALLTLKEELKTRDGKPYFRVAFRDAGRETIFPIWNDAPWADECRRHWAVGVFYKLRAVYRETTYGPQLEIKKVRETVEADAADGFDPLGFLPGSKYDPATMFEELCELAREKIASEPLRELTLLLYTANRDRLLTLPAATKNHHAFVGGYLEHVRSVARTAVYLADKYAEYYDDLDPPLDKDLVVAGAMLHDIGKLRELELFAEGPSYTAAGSLIGHVLQGRDMVREAAAELARRDPPTLVDAETLLRLEHIIVSHQRLPEWGAPKPPMTPEALLVHYADDADAKFNMVVNILREDATPGHTTSKKNVLMQQFYKGKQK